MSCDNLPTTVEIEQVKKDITDFNTFMTSDADTFVDSNGILRLTLKGAIISLGFIPAGFDFTTGGTLTERDKAIFYQTDGNWYSWGGTLPKVVPPASSPASTGGIADNAWNVSTSAFMYRDWEGFTAELLAQAGIADDGLPDELGASKRVDAIKAITLLNYTSVADMLNASSQLPLVGTKCSSGRTLWVFNGGDRTIIANYTPLTSVDFRDFGAVSDDSTDCLAAIISARSAGFKTLFDGQFYMSGVGVLIDGFPIEMTDGSFIRCDTDPGNYSKCEFLTDFRIKNERFDTDITLTANVGDIIHSSLSAGAAYLSDETLTAISFANAETTNISDYNTRSAFSGVVVDNLVLAWPTPSPVESGFFVDVETASIYESTFLLLNSITGGSAFVSVLTTTDRYFFDLTLGNTDVEYAKVSAGGTGTVIRSFTTDSNANLAIAPSGGGVTASVRITSHDEFEFYLNDIFVAREKVDGYIQQAGFTTITAGEVQISKPVRYQRKIPKGSKSFKVLCIGDSQTFGVGTTKTWPDYLQVLASNTHGLGDLDVTNIAVSGTDAAYWDAQVIDYSQYDYVMMMIGTNDVQSVTPINSYGNYMQNIITDVKTQGAIPIVGIFPLWTTKANSGNGDPFAQNNQLAARYRSELKSRCAITGAAVANPLGYLGNNIDRMSDNIHPDDQGCISIASAFVAALSTDAGPRRQTINAVLHHPKLLGGWQNDTGIYAPLTYCKDSSGVVTISGSVRNGVDLFETFATLPIGYRPAKNTVFPCVMNGTFGTMWVESNGNMQFMTGDTSGLCSIHATFFAS